MKKNIYELLMGLCEEEGSPFYFTDTLIRISQYYRIFNYRMATYTDFCKPGALEARGIMFLINDEGCTQQLVCLPMEKFFNLGENPFTDYDIEHLIENATLVMNKEDGSLISSYINHQGALKLKSKGSLSSDQAIDSMKWLALPENLYMKFAVSLLTNNGHTVNMEWVAPHNRIVLGYTKPELRVLNARDMRTGQYINHELLFRMTGNATEIFKDSTQIGGYRSHIGVEGYVVCIPDRTIKLKTDWYCTRHHNKDSVNCPRRLFEACLDEATDDLKQMFEEDTLALNLIMDMEEKAKGWYLDLAGTVNIFYDTQKHLSQKEYAIMGQNVLTKMQFGLAMSLYHGRLADFKGIMKKNYKRYVGEE